MCGYRNEIPTVHLSHNILLSTCSKLNIGLAITFAKRILDNKDSSSHYNHNKMSYQKLVLIQNGGGIENPRYDARRKENEQPKYLVYNGLPCIICNLLIPIGARMVRRRAGASSKYMHVACYERVYHTTIPLIMEAEQDAMRLGLYPAMRIPTTK